MIHQLHRLLRSATLAFQRASAPPSSSPTRSGTAGFTSAPAAAHLRSAFLTGASTALFSMVLAANSMAAPTFVTSQDAAVVIGQPNFATNTATPLSASHFPEPSGVAISATGILAVASNTSGRVLLFPAVPTANGAAATVVVGQSSFTTTSTAVNAATLGQNGAAAVAFSPDGKLIATDVFRHRVLIWNTIPTTNGQPADVVIGQPNMTSSGTAVSATGLNRPVGVFVTPDGKLLIQEFGNNRVLIYNTIPTTNGAAADVVIGQTSFTTNGTNTSASGLRNPEAVALAPDGRLLVADRGNNRVLIYAGVPTSNGASATTVIGQTAMGVNSAGLSATKMNNPWGIAVSATGQLAVSDYLNNRVLFYDSVPTSNGAAAKAVLGQPNFTSSTAFSGGISAHSMTHPFDLTFTTDGRLLVGGIDGSNRLLIFAPATPPAALAGSSFSVNEGASVVLDGTASHDTNSPAQPLTYLWTQLSGPTVIALSGANTATPSFTTPSVPAAGAALVFQLAVDNGVSTATDTVTVNVVNVNNPPIADAGPFQTVGENTLVTLDGSQSSDLDHDPLTVHWTQLSGPLVTLSGADAISPSFTAPDVTFAQGTVDLQFQLVANDGMVNSGPSAVTIHVTNTNDAPLASAGANQSVNELDPVALNGAASSDPDSNALTYSWTQILGTPIVSLTAANTATPSFTAPELNIGGLNDGTTLTFQLIVNDGTVDSAPSTVNVRVTNVNHAPLADAGDDQTLPEGTLVTLNGANSADVDGDTLTHTWVQTDGPIVTLSGTNTAAARFTTPDVGATGAVLTFQLTVDDGYGGVTSDEIIVNVTYINHPPLANAGAPQTVDESTTANLAGTASDPDGNPLAISWSQVSGPAVTILNGSTLAPSFAAPLVTLAEADVTLRLSVNDGYGGTASSDVTVHIANINHPPTAAAPANINVPEGTLVDLIGQGNDPDTEEQSLLTYSWQQIAPGVGPVYAGATLGLTAPMVTAGGDPNAKVTLTFRLTTTDPNGVSATDDVDVVVTNVEHAPTAIAGGNLNVNEAASVTLNGSASTDPDWDALTYAWVQVAGPAVVLNDANTAYPHFTAPFVNAAGATLKFKLTVNDGFGGTSSDCATVAVANINDAPIATNALASLGTLWPPDHSMVKVSILGIVDPNNNATITITGVTQDEATNGLGDGDTAIDAIINPDGTVLVRSERSGKGDGRVYRISFTVSDLEGSASGVVKVGVPKSKKTDAAIDSGVSFDSTH